ncbi:MAG: hypothetical protein WC514_03475 [Candidatus Paceibacterota bacterium]
MATFVLQERKKGGRWKRSPEFSPVRAGSFKKAKEGIRDQLNIMNSMDIALRCVSPIFSGDRGKDLQLRIRRVG